MNYQFKIIKEKGKTTRYFIYHATIYQNKKLMSIAFNDNKDTIDYVMFDDISNIEIVVDQLFTDWYFAALFQQLFDRTPYLQPINKLIEQYFKSFVA